MTNLMKMRMEYNNLRKIFKIMAKMGIKTTVFGTCGKDMQGEIAIKSLEKLGVDVKNIIILDDVRTRCFHVSYFDNDGKLSFASKKRCPFCNNKKWYENSLIDTDNIMKNINEKIKKDL